MLIPEKTLALFEKTELISFGTADDQGKPNVVAIFWKKHVGENRILLIDNYMRATKSNIQINNSVCISFWDPKTEEGYKLKGTAKYHTEGPEYEAGKEFIQEKKPDRIPEGVVEILVEEVYDITPGPDAGKKIP